MAAAALLRALPAPLPANWVASWAPVPLLPLAAVLLQPPAQRPTQASASTGLQLATAPAADRSHPQPHGCPGHLPVARAPRALPAAAACPPPARCAALLLLLLLPSVLWDLQAQASRLLLVS